MHLKKLEDYQSVPEDRALFDEIDRSIESIANVESVVKSQKIEIALAALYVFARPYSAYPFTPGFIDGIELITKLSPGGQLELARSLIDQVCKVS
jgi:hypothetical protein